jgi:hypothetical protein
MSRVLFTIFPCMNLKLLLAAIVCQLLVLAAAADTPAVAANVQLTKVFKVPPDFLTTGSPDGKSTALTILKAAGIDFPEGASAAFNPATSQLIVRNTESNLKAVEAFVDKLMKKLGTAMMVGATGLPARVPIYITVSVQCYEIAKKDPLVAEAQTARLDAKKPLQKIGALAARGMAKVVALPTVSARSGRRATTSNGDIWMQMECIIGPDGDQVYLSAAYSHGTQKVPVFKATIPVGATVFMGQLDGKGKDTVELVFAHVSAQPVDPQSTVAPKTPPPAPVAIPAAKTPESKADIKAMDNGTTRSIPATQGPPPLLGIDALAPVDTAKHAEVGAVWNRTANGIEWQANGGNPPYAGTFMLPVQLPPSYAIEVEFTCGTAKESVGITIPVGENRVTTCWFASNGYAGIGKIDGVDPHPSSIPGTASRFILEQGRRYTARAEVRRDPEGVDIQFLVDGKPQAGYRGPTSRLYYSTMWRIGAERTHVLLGASNHIIFHRATVKALDDLKSEATSPTPAPAQKRP